LKLRPQRASDEPKTALAQGGELELALYRGAWGLAAPFIPLILNSRAKQGKEDVSRLNERLGWASLPRPQGRLVWIHGASVGESLASLALVSALLKNSDCHVLVTTGTVTSARLMAERLPQGAVHQYAPIDTRSATKRFLDHWRPNLALFIESELWPNLIVEGRARAIKMALVNARMSQGSFRRWRMAPGLVKRLLRSFDECLAQDDGVADRLTALGAANVRVTGSLKADAPALPVDEAAFRAFSTALGVRPLFLAASTHPGEDAILLEVAQALRNLGSNALTVIVPRHPNRGSEIETMARAKGFVAERRATGALPAPATQIYIADTLGELGLFYRATNFAFLGGSLVPHGGQNPLEAARLNTAVLTGPYTQNFEDIFGVILAAQGKGRVTSASQLIALVSTLIGSPIAAARLGAMAKAAVQPLGGALSSTMRIAESLLGHARS
jgi:3-deoxy-D-manno-octulosonic-acid transferase